MIYFVFPVYLIRFHTTDLAYRYNDIFQVKLVVFLARRSTFL